jgi:hypothetical protein
VADLARVGAELASTRGVGRTKLGLLVEDLVQIASEPAKVATDPLPMSSLIATIRKQLGVIAGGPPSPSPHDVAELFQAIVAALPPQIQARRLDTLPWASEWCYTTRVWSELRVFEVADLANSGGDFARARGIGRGKVLALAEELLFLCPELHASAQPIRTGQNGEHTHNRNGGQRVGAAAKAVSIVSAIDRLAERLEPRDRDVLRRRIGWRFHRKSEILRTLADTHGVTQERVRQIEVQLRKRLSCLLQFQRFPDALREVVLRRQPPVPLDVIVACGRREFQGMMEVWRPLAALLADEGGPYLIEDPNQGGRVFVSLSPKLRASSLPRGRSRSGGNHPEPCLSWPTPTSSPRSAY